MSELKDAVVVITGGGTGVGRGLALEAAHRGAKVLIASISDAGDAVREVRAAGGVAEWFDVDVADYAAMQDLAKHARSTFGEVNVLVNNAIAGGGNGSLLEADPDKVRRVFEVNITGVFNGIRAFAEDLKASAAAGRPAYVLNVGSEHSLGVPPHVPAASAYTVSKYASLALTDVSRRDFAGTGVDVSLLAPGWVLTELVQKFVDQSADFAASVLPYAQTPREVARAAFDGLLQRRYIIVTNPQSVPFAREHAESILAELSRAALEASESRTSI